MSFKKLNFKNVIAILLIAVILIGTVAMLVHSNNFSIEEQIALCEQQIESNNNQIEQHKSTQRALHELANSLRNDENPDQLFINHLGDRWVQLDTKIQEIVTENEQLHQEVEELKKQLPQLKFVGYFTISHYDICYQCCGKTPSHPAYGITATGTRATPNRTIAVDSSVIPLGSEVVINGHTYVAEDTGGAIKGNRIDVCVATHAEGLQKGMLYNVPVYVMVKQNDI